MVLDIGPSTIDAYRKVLTAARTIFWNGPMGVFEKPRFTAGTVAIARPRRQQARAHMVSGSGSAAAIAQAGLADKVSHVSTGGGAALEFVQRLELPGIATLKPWALPRPLRATSLAETGHGTCRACSIPRPFRSSRSWFDR